MELDDYTGSVFRFLEKTKPGQIFTIEKICKSENRERFIEAVKLWIRSFPFGAGVEFNCDYTKIKIFRIPEIEKIKPLINVRTGTMPESSSSK